MSLPSREEFIEKLKKQKRITFEEWNVGLYRCPRCNGEVKRDYSVMYMSDPPKYRYFCKDCSNYEEIM